jgi:hypothetical protein
MGVPLLFFDHEREGSGTLKKRERLTHWIFKVTFLCQKLSECLNKKKSLNKIILGAHFLFAEIFNFKALYFLK